MKNNLISVLVSCVILSLAAATGHSQSFTLSPDSGTAGQSLQVTIVGSGTHFKPTTQASIPLLEVDVLQSGQTYTHNALYGDNVTSNTLLTTTLNLPSTLTSGWYDVVVARRDSTIYTYSLANALFVRPPLPVLLAATPKNAYRGQTIAVRIDGFATGFTSPASQYTINFEQSGNVIFFSPADTFFSSTALGTSITVVSAIVPGPYDISIIGGGISYHAQALFTVLAGQPPTIQVSPDTGISGQTLNVTITGQNNDFLPGMNASESAPYTVALLSGSSTAFSTTSRAIPSPSVLDATLVLKTFASGVYSLNVTGNGLNISSSFYVTPHPTIVLAQHYDTIHAGSDVTINVSGLLTHFQAPGTLSAKIANRYNLQYNVAATSIVATSDTSVTASFRIPNNFQTGFCKVFVYEPNQIEDDLDSAAYVLPPQASVEDGEQSAGEIAFLEITPDDIQFTLLRNSYLRLRIFDAIGHTIAVLCDGNVTAGPHSFNWHTPSPTGMYFYEMVSSHERRLGKLLMSK